MKNNRQGFTLAELLIVVAIIAVLVAIAIVVLTSQLEKSREATDIANVRAAYAEVMTAALSDDSSSSLKQADGTYQAVVSPLKQKDAGFKISDGKLNIGGITPDNTDQWKGEPSPGGSCTVTYYPNSDKVVIDWGGSGGGGDDPGSGSSIPSSTKTAIEEALLDLIGTPQSSHTITVTVNNGVVNVDFHGNPHHSVTEEAVINTLKGIDGVTFDDSGRMLYNGNLVTDSVSVHYKPNGH